MLIQIKNSLPSIYLHLRLIEDEVNKMRMLLDTGATMDSGNLNYYLWIMSQCPEIIDEFIQCECDTGYDFVKVMATLDLDTTKQLLDYGRMTAVIRYRIPYLVNNQDPLFVSFALGNNVSLHCVIGLPALLTLGGLIDLTKGTFVCSEINRTFSLTLDPPGKGSPDEVVFDNSTPTIPVGVSTDVRLDPSFLHYTSAEGRTLPSSTTNYSEHVIVHDKLFPTISNTCLA